VRRDDFLQPFEDALQPLCEFALPGFDAAARDVAELSSGGFDDAEAGDLQSRIDAENSQSITAVV
jgi:hypothetical protein